MSAVLVLTMKLLPADCYTVYLNTSHFHLDCTEKMIHKKYSTHSRIYLACISYEYIL